MSKPALLIIRNNLLVEGTSNAFLGRFLGWLLKKHTLVCFWLYTAGAHRLPSPPGL